MMLPMGERSRWAGSAVAIAAFLGLGAGCSGTADLPGASTEPSAPSTLGVPYVLGPCHHVVIYPKEDPPLPVAAYDWDDNVHAYGESVSITGCVAGPFVVVPDGPPGVTFDPVQQQAVGEFGVVTFTVTVPEGGTGPIYVQIDYLEGGTYANAPGPVITPFGNGWKFTAPDVPL